MRALTRPCVCGGGEETRFSACVSVCVHVPVRVCGDGGENRYCACVPVCVHKPVLVCVEAVKKLGSVRACLYACMYPSVCVEAVEKLGTVCVSVCMFACIYPCGWRPWRNKKDLALTLRGIPTTAPVLTRARGYGQPIWTIPLLPPLPFPSRFSPT